MIPNNKDFGNVMPLAQTVVCFHVGIDNCFLVGFIFSRSLLWEDFNSFVFIIICWH